MDEMSDSEADAKYRSFISGADAENSKYWAERSKSAKRDSKREHKGIYFLMLSLISLLGGMAGIIYGLAGKDWIQKPYLVLGAFMILIGLSIVIGGFGKVRT